MVAAQVSQNIIKNYLGIYMTSQEEKIVNDVNELKDEIVKLQPYFHSCYKEFTDVLKLDFSRFQLYPFQNSNDYWGFWKRLLYKDTLGKIQIILEANFNFVETIGLSATARHLMELLIWLKLSEKDLNYVKLFYRHWLKDAHSYKKTQRIHWNRELRYFSFLSRKQKDFDALKNKDNRTADEVRTPLYKINEVQEKVWQVFYVHSDPLT